MVLAENLVMLRNVKGMTQEQVAEVIGIPQSQVPLLLPQTHMTGNICNR